MKLKIAIIGTRGIPNRYGGFEQLAEYLSVGLMKKGHEVFVYNSHKHPYNERSWNGVRIERCFDPEYKIGTAGQFIYDLNCVRNARQHSFDVILLLGYSSSSVWGPYYPSKPVIISNMDGLEWKRLKYSRPVRWFLKHAESFAVKYSDYFIADSPAIQSYLKNKYTIESRYIPYGAKIFNEINENTLKQFNVEWQEYFMLMSRMEPENNIEMILDGFHQSNSDKNFLVIGAVNNRFGKYIFKKFRRDQRIIFTGAIYNNEITHTLKAASSLYFHGHSVGGTNPSLLEAMASKALIAAHDNDFNRAVIQQDGYYFNSSQDVKTLIENKNRNNCEEKMICNNLKKIKNEFNPQRVVDEYESFIEVCYLKGKK